MTSGKEQNRKIVRNFIKMCGIADQHHAEEMIIDAAELALQIEGEFAHDDTENAIILTLMGYALMNLGIDRVLTDWGWQDPEISESSPISAKTYTKLTRECFANHFRRIKNDYKEKRIQSSSEGGTTS